LIYRWLITPQLPIRELRKQMQREIERSLAPSKPKR
jgi:hypothetical protein